MRILPPFKSPTLTSFCWRAAPTAEMPVTRSRMLENLLPTLDCPNPEPARNAIREIFLSKITAGKGLDEIVRATGREPSPTPYALYEYCKYIGKFAPEFGEFLLIDMGGATTDVYSFHEEINISG